MRRPYPAGLGAIATGIALANLGIFVVSLSVARRHDLLGTKLPPETYQMEVKSDEPKMVEQATTWKPPVDSG